MKKQPPKINLATYYRIAIRSPGKYSACLPSTDRKVHPCYNHHHHQFDYSNHHREGTIQGITKQSAANTTHISPAQSRSTTGLGKEKLLSISGGSQRFFYQKHEQQYPHKSPPRKSVQAQAVGKLCKDSP